MRDLDLTPRQFGFLGSSFSFLFAISGILVGLWPTISPPAGCFSPSHFPGRSCSFRWLAQPGSRRWWLVACFLALVQGDRRRSQRLGEIEPAVKKLITLAESGADPQSVVPRLKELDAYKTKKRRHVIEIHPRG
jgi:hypothetical protein